MPPPSLTLSLLPGAFAICRLHPAAEVPGWATRSGFYSITRTPDELSIVCPQANVPAGLQPNGDWRALKVQGPLDLSLVGIMASLTAPLANARVNLLALSTYDTDYLLVKQDRLEEAVRALGEAGFKISPEAE